MTYSNESKDENVILDVSLNCDSNNITFTCTIIHNRLNHSTAKISLSKNKKHIEYTQKNVSLKWASASSKCIKQVYSQRKDRFN